MTRLIVDVGAFQLKALFLTNHTSHTIVAPCAVGASPTAGRGLIGTALSEVPSCHGLMIRRPIEKGLLVDPVLFTVLLQSVILDQIPKSKWNASHTTGNRNEFSTASNSFDLVLTLPFGTPEEIVVELVRALWQRFGVPSQPGAAVSNNNSSSSDGGSSPLRVMSSLTFVSSSLLALVAQDYINQSTASTTSLLASSTMKGKEEPRNVTANLTATTTGTAVVVDAGFSGCVVVPYMDYHPVRESIVRGRVGGQLLTNRLKEHLSFTQMNLMEDGVLVNVIKERCCYVQEVPSLHGVKAKSGVELRNEAIEQQSARRKRARVENNEGDTTARYVLPTLPSIPPTGCHLADLPSGLSAADRDNLQILYLGNERYLISELLFSPSDVGVRHVGVADLVEECFSRSESSLTKGLGRLLFQRYVTYGGTSSMVGFHKRFYHEWTSTNQNQLQGDCASVHTNLHSLVMKHLSSGLSGVSNEALLPLLGASVLWGHKTDVSFRAVVDMLQKRIAARSTVTFGGSSDSISSWTARRQQEMLDACCVAMRQML